MRLIVGYWLCVLTVLIAPRAAVGAVTASFRCQGGSQLVNSTNLLTLHKIAALKTWVPLQKVAMNRMALVLARGLNLGTNAQAAILLEPLVNDFLETESVGSFGEPAQGPLDFIVVLRLDAERKQIWHENLDKALGERGETFATQEQTGWRWKSGVWILPVGGWLLAGRGNVMASELTEYLTAVKAQGRPAPALRDNWLEADVDGTRLGSCLPDWMRLLKPARMKLTIAGDGDNLQLTAHLVYPGAMPWKAGPWKLPEDRVKGPLTSFTTGRDVAAFLNMSPAFARLEGEPLTGQFCLWAMGQFPFLTFGEWPMDNATNVLEKLAPAAVKAFSPELKEFNGTELAWQTNHHALVLENLRIIQPALRAEHYATGECLTLSLFPPPPTNKPVPAGLWKQIEGRTNLVYYDWELTGLRLQQWRMLGRMLLSRPRPQVEQVMRPRNLEEKWFTEMTKETGNTVTEITRTAPNELTVARTGPVGLTAVEIFLLSDWLNGVGAPPIQSRPASN